MNLSVYIIPIIVSSIIVIALVKRKAPFDIFIKGCKEGLLTVYKLIPILIGLIVSIEVFKSSGAMEYLVKLVAPITNLLNIPKEVMPLALLRPISGSASIAMLTSIYKDYGADSFIGMVASTMMGSTETIFYTLTVYCGCIGIKKTRYVLAVALVLEVISVIMAVQVNKRLFV